MPEETVISCAPNTIAEAFPCVRCLNGDQQRWSAIVYILWRLVNGSQATFSVDTLNADAACFNCVPPGDLLNQLISILVTLAVANRDLSEVPVIADGACLQCEDVLGLQRKALYLFCQWANAVGAV